MNEYFLTPRGEQALRSNREGAKTQNVSLDLHLDAMLEVLDDKGPSTSQDLVAALGQNLESTRATIRRGHEQGYIGL